jgi:O-methyltransferase
MIDDDPIPMSRATNALITRIWELRPLAMVLPRGLLNLKRRCLEHRGGGGAFVECGVARGGCLALMAYIAGSEQVVWGFDSFEELPALTAEDQDSGTGFVGFQCSGPGGEHAVPATFATLNVPMGNVRVVKGWFEETLPAHLEEIGEISVLRLDSDWYASTRFCLETLYDSVVPGGAVIIDDYFMFAGCRKAVDEFRAARNIDAKLHTVDPRTEAYWYK